MADTIYAMLFFFSFSPYIHVLVSFLLLGQKSEIIKLLEGKIYFGSRFQSMVSLPHCFCA
jgi:hypothetical protein